VTVARRLRLLAYTDSTEVGGAELALGYLLGALSAEIEVGVLATDERVASTIASSRADASMVVVRGPRGSYDSAALREHLSAIRRFAPDILHANQAWPWACAYGELAGLLTRGTRVLAVDHLPLAVAVPRARRLGRQLLARRLDAHVAVGARCARMVEQIVGLRRDSVLSVPNGVPGVPIGPGSPDAPGVADVSGVGGDSGVSGLSTRAESARSTGRGATDVVIGSLGRLTEQKGYDLLVRALPTLAHARLVLVGDGPQRGDLERLARELGVADRLTITGWVLDAPSRLAGFDVFALPSRWEGMPLGILEAMHAGLPVLATAVGSVDEVVADGDTGYVVAPEDLDSVVDRLRRLIAAEALRSRMGERGRDVARELYSDVAMARRYEAVYQGLVGWWRPARGQSVAGE
jgi:glycosyltransferase involved in cell wall biosynthesis